jgi:hypothetical protein
VDFLLVKSPIFLSGCGKTSVTVTETSVTVSYECIILYRDISYRVEDAQGTFQGWNYLTELRK